MEIKSYQLNDEHAIVELFRSAFGKEMSLEYWNWRFANNPFSKKMFIELMWDNDLLVGHYAISPVEMLIKNQKTNTALSMTTMTHPEYGGKGIFSQLAESLYKKLSKEDFKFVWGFPNNNSHYGFKKNLGWEDIAIQGMMSLNVSKILNIINQNTEGVQIKSISEVNDEFIFSLNISEKLIKINKTRAYIQWRYFDNPTTEYKIITTDKNRGIVIYKKIPSFSHLNKYEIDIMDIFYDNDMEVLINLLSFIYNSEEDLEQFNIWDSLFSENQINLEKIGFRVSPPITYLGYKNLDYQNYEIANYRNWDMSLSYSDVF